MYVDTLLTHFKMMKNPSTQKLNPHIKHKGFEMIKLQLKLNKKPLK